MGTDKMVRRSFFSLFFIVVLAWVLSAFALVMQVQIAQALWWEQIPDLGIGTAMLFTGAIILWLTAMKLFWGKVAKSLLRWVVEE